jgi:hypothetical protein|tara:strand:+ start:10071 stop:10304 length:234 start_codon:yes stop_codon:yes gene_type:complete
MKVKIELDVLHFMSILNLLIEADKGIEEVPTNNLEFALLQEACKQVNEQFQDQYTEGMGCEFEMQYQIRELLFNTEI